VCAWDNSLAYSNGDGGVHGDRAEEMVSRVFGFGRKHPVLVISLVVSVVSISAASVWAVKYDDRTSKTLLPGTVIEGVPVGGLRYEAAVEKVREKVEAPLHRPIRVQTEDFSAQTTAWELGLQVDVPAIVQEQMDKSHDGNIVTRVWKRVTGNGSAKASAAPAWGDGQMSSLLETAANEVALEPKSAVIDTSTGFVEITEPKAGRELDLERSRQAMLDAILMGQESVELVTNSVEPEGGVPSQVILVRTGENKLYLYENGSVTKTWNVATGTSEFPTPTGLWRVTSKIVNPTWINPGSDWARSMPKTIPPGPSNPLGERALALNASGILIHATPDVASIGYSASHGCIRMTPSDERELFGMVSEGTPVAIVKAGPPKPRGSAPPPAAAPEQVAASQF
jgi:lipoprotein-anchoring transpeptidase ErfK/SrfK